MDIVCTLTDKKFESSFKLGHLFDYVKASYEIISYLRTAIADTMLRS